MTCAVQLAKGQSGRGLLLRDHNLADGLAGKVYLMLYYTKCDRPVRCACCANEKMIILPFEAWPAGKARQSQQIKVDLQSTGEAHWLKGKSFIRLAMLIIHKVRACSKQIIRKGGHKLSAFS